jgi:hypothetical protein
MKQVAKGTYVMQHQYEMLGMERKTNGYNPNEARREELAAELALEVKHILVSLLNRYSPLTFLTGHRTFLGKLAADTYCRR